MKRIVFALCAFMVFFAVLPVLADDEVAASCTISVQSQKDNQLVVHVQLQNAEVGHIFWPLGPANGVEIGSDWTGDVNLSYDAPNRALQRVNIVIPGSSCFIDVTVTAWQEVPTPGPTDPGTGSSTPMPSAPSVPVAAGSKGWQCVQINGWSDAVILNKFHFVVTFQGQLPDDYVATIDFGDGSQTALKPGNGGATAEFTHDYDLVKLVPGLTIEVTPVYLGDFQPCLTVYIDGSTKDFSASNTNGTQINPR